MKITPVILAGGIGLLLWPLWRKSVSKPFAALILVALSCHAIPNVTPDGKLVSGPHLSEDVYARDQGARG